MHPPESISPKVCMSCASRAHGQADRRLPNTTRADLLLVPILLRLLSLVTAVAATISLTPGPREPDLGRLCVGNEPIVQLANTSLLL
ncbi:unnamed protein product [Protopolystoma xenopodis]|uniref:Uncharacterized protein n=1 Tax=Protopolystoma xenopodis TaxID=117903 RepID=A0A3S5B9W0_9PLAT|nr:unnamed protein product [Protopolystoma xenopodis]